MCYGRATLFTRVIILLPALFFLSVNPALSKKFSVEGLREKRTLGLYLDYIEDTSNQLTLNDVIKGAFEDKWIPSEEELLGFGFTSSQYFIRFTIENPTDTDKTVFLQQEYPLVDSMVLLIPEGKSFRKIEVGDLKPFKERPYEHRTFIIPLTLPSNSTKTCYIEYKTASAMNIDLNLWDPEIFEKNALYETRLLMFYYGIISVMILYNLFIYQSEDWNTCIMYCSSFFS